MAHIKVTSPSFSKNTYLVGETRKYFPNTEFNTAGKEYSSAELSDYLADAEGAIIGLDSIDDHMLASLPRLKIIAKYGVGLDNIDQEACARRNISLGWTGGLNKRSVSEQVLAFMISLSRNIYASSYQLKHGTWNKSGGAQLSEKKVGIIGMGHIGKDLVSLLQPFHCKILANDIIDQSAWYHHHDIKEASKEEIYQNADIITLHIPLTMPPHEYATYHLMNEHTLGMMKRTAFLINTSRGKIVDQQALKEALKTGKIGGAALDVYETFDGQKDMAHADREFLMLPNLICTPHIGGSALEGIQAMGMSAINHLVHYFGVQDSSPS